MLDVDIAGIGVWSHRFANWGRFREFCRGTLEADPESKLQPELIPARERRRAPEFVRMAITVMDQACQMAGIDRSDVATVFASGMGDMQITDYMCRTLASMPRAVSPTKFHNSVHNASTGYWSIATASTRPASAVSGYDHSGAIALLEGAAQVVTESIPVLVTAQEMAAPVPFRSVYAGGEPLAVALLLTVRGQAAAALGSLSIGLSHDASHLNAQTLPADQPFAGNFAAALLPLLHELACGQNGSMNLPVSSAARLSLSCCVPASSSSARG